MLRSNPGFRRLWIGQLVSLGGDWFNVVALTGLLLHLTGSGFSGGAVLVASLSPQFLLPPVAGEVADRFDRRRLMLGANLIAGIVLVAHLGSGTRYTMTSYGLQRITPDRVRGRIMAFELGLVTLTMSVSLLAAGRAAEVVNPRAVVELLSGPTVGYAAGGAFATRHLWRQPAPALADTLAVGGS